MEVVKEDANSNKDPMSDSDSSIEFKRKSMNSVVDYRVKEDDERYESSSDDCFPSSSMSSSSSVSSASSPEPHLTKKQEEKKKEPWKETKTKGEMSLDDLPRIEDLHLNVLEDDLKMIGQISAIVDRLVVVQSLKDLPALDMDSVLFLKYDKPLGQVFDTFGPVSSPYYCVRFNSGEEIKQKGIEVGTDVFYAPTEEEYTNYVLYQEIKQDKGSDASWKNNNEPPIECLDFSDDEAELSARKLKKGQRVLENDVTNGGTQTTQSGSSIMNQNVSTYRPAMTKEQNFFRPATSQFRQSRMPSFVSSVSQPSLVHSSRQSLKMNQPYGNPTIRPQINFPSMSSPMMHNMPHSFASNHVVSPCMVNVSRPPPPLLTSVNSQPPRNMPPQFSSSIGSHNYTANQQHANIQTSFNPGTFNQMYCNPTVTPQAATSRQQPFGQVLPGIGMTMQCRKPVFAAPPIFNLFCLPPPPPPPATTSNVEKPAISQPQVNFMRPPSLSVAPAQSTMNQISTTSSSFTMASSPDTYSHPSMFNRYPISNLPSRTTVQPSFYMPFAAATASRPNEYSSSVSMFSTPTQFASPPPECGIAPRPANVQPTLSQISRYPPSVASQSSYFLR